LHGEDTKKLLKVQEPGTEDNPLEEYALEDNTLEDCRLDDHPLADRTSLDQPCVDRLSAGAWSEGDRPSDVSFP
jgi:hypothetical protein